jgi:HAD superfamily hydrolase (TIGR01509 family)
MKYQLVIFDMDGTLTEELLDFAAIRRDMGLPGPGGILEQLALMEASARAKAQAILDGHECAAAERCGAHAGAAELLQGLRQRGIKTALLTRNSAANARRILGRNCLELDHVAARENLPHKPHPGSILNITRKFGFELKQTLMVGDYLYDLQAAKAAGVDCALLHMNGGELPAFAEMATYVVQSLGELKNIVE